MNKKNDIIESDQSLDTLIVNSIELIQYVRQLVAKQVNNRKIWQRFSKANLEFFRRFYLNYEERIAETVFRQLEEKPPFIVSWSHYLQLMRI